MNIYREEKEGRKERGKSKPGHCHSCGGRRERERGKERIPLMIKQFSLPYFTQRVAMGVLSYLALILPLSTP